MSKRGHLVSCERGPADRRPILLVPPNPGARAVLVLPLADGVTCSVRLAPRYARFLCHAVDAWRADEDEVDTLRGFRSAEQIGIGFGGPAGDGHSITEQSVRGYVYEIKVQISRAVSELRLETPEEQRDDLDPPPLLESQRILGYRIGPCGLDILHTRPRSGPTFTD